MMKLTAQELCNHLMFVQRTHDREPGIASNILRYGDFFAQERECDHDEENDHQHKLYKDDLPEILVESADTQHQGAAESKLNPTGVRDLSRHLVSNHHGAQRINPSRDGIQN